MRSIWRTLDPRLARDIGLVLLAVGIVGISFGAITVSSGFPLWLPMLLSLLVFGGASQFIFIGIVASGGNPIAAVLAGLLINARHLPFGFAIGDLLGRGWQRVIGAHLMIDESVAFALAQRDLVQRKAVYWTCGVGLFVCWNIAVVIGAVAGTAVSDTAAFGLDAAFPAVLLALVLPALKDPQTRYAALAGAVIALATTPLLPAGLPVLVALFGMFALRLGRERSERVAA
ncbi:MAG: branched-chain amino acid ABC transporter permease [Actinophytocola sp.]|nr:branched-chain amino acid ABC transporter permease [Actinophytocola sp.]